MIGLDRLNEKARNIDQGAIRVMFDKAAKMENKATKQIMTGVTIAQTRANAEKLPVSISIEKAATMPPVRMPNKRGKRLQTAGKTGSSTSRMPDSIATYPIKANIRVVRVKSFFIFPFATNPAT